MKYKVIFNPVAGNGNSLKAMETIKQYASENGIELEIHETTHPKHATEITRELTSSNSEVNLICVGGDGTLNEVLNGIVNFEKTKLGIISSGAGNDFPRAADLPSNEPIEAFKIILENNIRKVDYMIVNDNLRFINLLGCGLTADILIEFDKQRDRIQGSKNKYKILTFKKSLFYKPYNIGISLDKGPFEFYDTVLFGAGNGISCGGGIKTMPNGIIDDGLISVAFIKKMSHILILPRLMKVMKGRMCELKHVVMFTCKELDIKLPENCSYETDGVVYPPARELNVKIGKEKLNLFSRKQN